MTALLPIREIAWEASPFGAAALDARERLSGFLCLFGRHAVVDRSPARIVIDIEESAYPDLVAFGVFYDSNDLIRPPNIGVNVSRTNSPGLHELSVKFRFCSASACMVAVFDA